MPEERMAKQPAERGRLYVLLAWFHALVQERLRYTPVGWSKSHEFSDADMKVLYTLYYAHYMLTICQHEGTVHYTVLTICSLYAHYMLTIRIISIYASSHYMPT
jgi:hypothetical protein